MKLMVAIIRPEQMEVVRATLREPEACLLSVSEVMGDGREPGLTESYRGREVRVQRPKLRLEMVVTDALVPGTVESITRAASAGVPGHLGNSKVFVMPLDGYVRIPGGQAGAETFGR
jgi:nitrogen regulatory protein P-II 1